MHAYLATKLFVFLFILLSKFFRSSNRVPLSITVKKWCHGVRKIFKILNNSLTKNVVSFSVNVSEVDHHLPSNA